MGIQSLSAGGAATAKCAHIQANVTNVRQTVLNITGSGKLIGLQGVPFNSSGMSYLQITIDGVVVTQNTTNQSSAATGWGQPDGQWNTGFVPLNLSFKNSVIVTVQNSTTAGGCDYYMFYEVN